MLPLLAVDFSFDRNTDIVLTTREGYYGFQQVRCMKDCGFHHVIFYAHDIKRSKVHSTSHCWALIC